MKDQNEVLYYRVGLKRSVASEYLHVDEAIPFLQTILTRQQLIQDHLKEMFSIIYTPTEGDAIGNFSRLFRKPEGCFLNIDEPERVRDNLAQYGDADDIDYIVVSDSEEILGIGDQGVGGILISVAKLVLTTLCAGIHPDRTLPVVLDCGTNNEKMLRDELYLGLKKPRIRGKRYDDFVEGFVQSARQLYPQAYIHFEDFGLLNARRILKKYRPQMACFNDDIQGTGCITLAGIMSGLFVSKLQLSDMRMVVFGSGSAGIGIADQVQDAIVAETGKSKEDAAKQIWCVDKPGLLVKSQGKNLTEGQVSFARDDAEWNGKPQSDLLSIIKEVKPHVLIGTSTKPKAFTESIVREMAQHVERPIIFPLSNPTRLHEADPKDINTWTEGRALIATGSPFPPVEYNGRVYEVAECNNSTVFPGIGLGAVLCRAKLLSDKMLVAAVKAIAIQSPALKDPDKGLVPDIVNVREISVRIAMSVIKQAVEEGLATEKGIPTDDADLEAWVREQMWAPEYRPLERVQKAVASKRAKGERGSSSTEREAHS